MKDWIDESGVCYVVYHQIYVTDVDGMKQEELLEKAMREMIRK